ncbi:MAG: hypothetical protein PHF72_08405, partial [Gammaproteobacteria bacterium]|nr:hypothetical protein [Gammaproteobacteria bacterium]
SAGGRRREGLVRHCPAGGAPGSGIAVTRVAEARCPAPGRAGLLGHGHPGHEARPRGAEIR